MKELPANLIANPKLSQWFDIDRSHVTICSGKVELGQGIETAMAIVAASELRLDVSQISIGRVDTGHAPNEGYTAGSFSIEHGGSALRVAAAMTRELFAEAAATRLGARPEDLIVEDGRFRAPGRNEFISYGDLADSVDLDVDARSRPFPRLLGIGEIDEKTHRRDLPGKLGGGAYIQDIRLPGMLFGRVLRPHSPNLRLRELNETAVALHPGVIKVVVRNGFAGVVAKRDEQALEAVERLRQTARWEKVFDLPEDNEEQSWIDSLAVKPTIIEEPQPARLPGRRKKASFSRPYLLHASIGPTCAVAAWDEGKLTVYSHTQGVYPLRAQLARVLGFDLSDVTVIHAHGSGCYGHNGADDVALDAALLAQAVGVPVMVMWSRTDELTWSPHAAAMRVQVEATQDEQGAIIDWAYHVKSTPHLARPGMGTAPNLLAATELGFRDEVQETPAPREKTNFKIADRGGDRNARPIYALPRLSLLHSELPQGPLRSSAMRGLGAHLNVFAIESFMDELALDAGRDPLEFRLAHLQDERAVAVLKAAADLGNWQPGEAGGEGRGRGLGLARYKGTGAYYACVVTVEVDETVRLVSVHGAVDAGHVVHKDGVLNQIEGGIIQSASWTLKERAGWNEDGFSVKGWDDYPIMGFTEIPHIETRVLRNSEPSVGVGEAAAGPVAAGIGNAVAHALGVRIRTMPITRERIFKMLMEG